jgi:uncharacterized protein YndB with AHSA1/START domain
VTVESFNTYFEPVRKSITVRCTPEQAFDLFTVRLSSWWPLLTHSIAQENAVACGIEPQVGGAVFELTRDGTRCAWGHVLTWDPPRRLTLYWHPGMEERLGQEVEVTFTPVDAGTRVDLEHRNWAQLGDQADVHRNGYDRGWEGVFVQAFATACNAVTEVHR